MKYPTCLDYIMPGGWPALTLASWHIPRKQDFSSPMKLSGGTHRIFRVTTSLQLTGNQCCSIGEVWSQRNTLCERVSPSDSGKQMGLLIGEVVSVRECSTRSGLCYAYRKCWWEPETNRKTELVAAAGDWPIVIRDFPLSALRGWQ